MALNPSAISFNGTSQHAKLSANASIKNMTAFTWMAWVKVGANANSPYKKLYVERQGTGSGIRFAVNAYHSRLRFELAVQDGQTDTNYDYRTTWDDYWHHIAFVARISGENPTYQMFKDGSLVAEGTLVKPAGVDNISNTAPLGSTIYVGNHSLHTSGGESFLADRYWHGKIDDVLIFDEAKSSGDITSYFSSNDTWDMGDTSMFSYWRFDENTGSSTVDADNGGWTGTLLNNNVASSGLWTIDRAFLGNGTVDTTAPTTPTLPGTPTTSITSDGFRADWNATTDNVYVQGYELQVSTVSNFASYTAYHNPNSRTTELITGLLPNTNYYWRVRAYDAELNMSGYAATQSLTTANVADLTPPNRPTNVTASSVTHSSFAVSWTGSTSPDVTGYKIDVGLDPNFNNYLSGYRNRDIGAVLTTTVSGTLPLTSYYVRLRAYDNDRNESLETDYILVQTPSVPDLIAPNVVDPLPATSITSRAFTASWEEGEDNVGVTGYYLDVSTASDFSSFVTGYQNLFVGNVTEYRVTGLVPETTYYYRTRATDAAGNISGNSVVEMGVTTLITSVEDGGITTVLIEPTADAEVRSASASTNYGSATSITVVGNGSAATQAAHLLFPLDFVTGNLTSAVLNIYVTEASAAAAAVKADNVTFTESTLTWTNQPAVAGSSVAFTPLATGWVAIPITSLLLDGKTTYDVYLSTTSADGFTFDSKEGTNKPYLEVEYDQSTATKLDAISVEAGSSGRVNMNRNPNFEGNATTGYAISAAGVTLSVHGTEGVEGTKALSVVSAGSAANLGFIHGDSIWTPATFGESVTVSFAARATTTESLVISVQQRNAAGSLLSSSLKTISVGTTRQRYVHTVPMDQATVAYYVVYVYKVAAAAYTAYFDEFLFEKAASYLGYFDGNTPGAYWQGATNASFSVMPVSKIDTATTYLGDSDQDNSVSLYIKPSEESEWITHPSLVPTVNRTTKRWEYTIEGGLGEYNLVPNPGFELDTANWSVINGATGFARQDTEVYEGSYAAVFTSAGSTSGIWTGYIPVTAGTVLHCRNRVKGPIGNDFKLVLRFYDAAGTTLLGTSDDVMGQSRFSALDGTWQETWVVATAPASTASVRVALTSVGMAGGPYYIDNVLLGYGANLNPYRDGSYPDAFWNDTEHNSVTHLMIMPERSYDIRYVYSDPDGLIDAPGSTTAELVTTYITTAMPDNTTTVGTITTESDVESITVRGVYVGDDNENMTMRVEWKRTDLTNWNTVTHAVSRDTKSFAATIPYLRAGTSYTIRFTFTDPDGVYNTTDGVVEVLATTMLSHTTPDVISRIRFGGFVLMDSADYTSKVGVTEHNAFGFPERRLQIEDLPREDGAIELQNLWGRRSISMQGFIEGDTRVDLEQNLQALKRALAPRLQRLQIDTLNDTGRYYTATCESLAIVESPENIRHLTWDADFVCADPFAYDTTVSTLPEFTASNGSTVTVNNVGDTRVPLRMNIRTTHTFPVTLSIINSTSGERISPSKTLISGDRLVIDSTRKSITKNGIELDYQGAFPHLLMGGNTFTFVLSATSGTPTILIEMVWQSQYL